MSKATYHYFMGMYVYNLLMKLANLELRLFGLGHRDKLFNFASRKSFYHAEKLLSMVKE